MLAATLLFCAAASADPAPETPAQFLSLKTEGANGRHGPGLEHRNDRI